LRSVKNRAKIEKYVRAGLRRYIARWFIDFHVSVRLHNALFEWKHIPSEIS
jgi:hypothetical protein